MTEYASYILKAYSSLQNLSIEQIFQFGRNQNVNENPIPSFDENLLVNLCLNAKKIFENEDVILNLEGDAIIVGDIHGSFHDLLRIIKYVDPIPFKVIFLGDYVDRGQFSLECITLLFSLKIMYPGKYFLLRGNHEFDCMCSLYGFKKEILNYHNPQKKYDIESEQTTNHPALNSDEFNFDLNESDMKQISTEQLCDDYFANHINMNCYKYTEKLYNSFMTTFSYLPIASIINKTSLCIHGGLTPLLDKVEKIDKQIQRPIDNYGENSLLCDILWGDPNVESNNLYNENPRGRGKLFNGVVVVNFLKNNNLQRIIRAHECVFEGIRQIFNDKCITVFSASSYSNDMSNKSGILKLFQKDDTIEKVVFEPIGRLKKCDAIYYKVQAFNGVKRNLPPIRLKSIVNCRVSNLKKDTDRVNYSKFSTSSTGRKNSQKKPSFKTGIQSQKISHACSVSINEAAFMNKCEPLNFEKNDSIMMSSSKSIDHLPMLMSNECI